MQTKKVGIILIIVGVLMMIYTGFTYVTKERVADIGPVEVNKTERHPVQWSPIVGGLLLVGGLLMVATDRNKGV
jgi:hypothetical protein